MSRPDPRNICDGCGQSLERRLRLHVELGPIVHDHIWRRLVADPREALCFMCMGLRAVRRLGRMLTLSNLRPCRWNLCDQPYSWLDLFVEMDGAPPSNLSGAPSAGPANSRRCISRPLFAAAGARDDQNPEMVTRTHLGRDRRLRRAPLRQNLSLGGREPPALPMLQSLGARAYPLVGNSWPRHAPALRRRVRHGLHDSTRLAPSSRLPAAFRADCHLWQLSMLTPAGEFYRLTIALPSGGVLTCHVAKVALKISKGEKP
jgi:hypothetical protein